MTKIVRFLDQRFEEVICAFGLSLMATCIIIQVLLRIFFDASAAWAEELAVYGMVTAIYLGASLAIRERAHIRITFLIEKLPRAIKLCTVILADALWFGFIVLLLTQSAIWIQLLFNTLYISPALGIDQKWPQSIVPFALCLMLVRMVQVYWIWLRDRERELPL